jgi:hypothetical protein
MVNPGPWDFSVQYGKRQEINLFLTVNISSETDTKRLALD